MNTLIQYTNNANTYNSSTLQNLKNFAKSRYNENKEYGEKSVIHNTSIASNKLPTIADTVAETVQKVMNFEIWQERNSIQLSESYWKEKENLYLRIENLLIENNLLGENNDCLPSWKIAGPLNYGMSLEQMKDAITKKFKEMVNSRNLITEKQLADYECEFFYKINKNNINLTRIWGAEFLKSNLEDSLTLNVAEHFMIVENPESEIEIHVFCGTDDPCVARILSNAYIVSKKIIGTDAAPDYKSSPELKELGYADFKDFGNIICDSNNIGWIVDTEAKSFDPPKWTESDKAVRCYLKNRFKALTNLTDIELTIKISPAELNL